MCEQRALKRGRVFFENFFKILWVWCLNHQFFIEYVRMDNSVKTIDTTRKLPVYTCR